MVERGTCNTTDRGRKKHKSTGLEWAENAYIQKEKGSDGADHPQTYIQHLPTYQYPRDLFNNPTIIQIRTRTTAIVIAESKRATASHTHHAGEVQTLAKLLHLADEDVFLDDLVREERVQAQARQPVAVNEGPQQAALKQVRERAHTLAVVHVVVDGHPRTLSVAEPVEGGDDSINKHML